MSVKSFDKLTPAGQRCRIARDVLKQLDAKKLVARHNTYLEAKHKDSDYCGFANNSVAEVMNIPTAYCEVCAMGALLACKVKYKNGITVEESGSRYSTLSSLMPYFDRLQIAMIEAAFEGSGHDGPGVDVAARDGVQDAWEMYNDASNHFRSEEFAKIKYSAPHFGVFSADFRMRDIMHNIIANRGTFVPHGKPTPLPVVHNQYTKKS